MQTLHEPFEAFFITPENAIFPVTVFGEDELDYAIMGARTGFMSAQKRDVWRYEDQALSEIIRRATKALMVAKARLQRLLEDGEQSASAPRQESEPVAG